jgi:hypothetical protein
MRTAARRHTISNTTQLADTAAIVVLEEGAIAVAPRLVDTSSVEVSCLSGCEGVVAYGGGGVVVSVVVSGGGGVAVSVVVSGGGGVAVSVVVLYISSWLRMTNRQ